MSSSQKKVSKKLIVWLVIISILIVMVIGVVFAMFIYNEKNKGEEFFDSGSIVMTYAENSDIFFINNMTPISDASGKINSVEGLFYDFTIKINLGDSSSSEYEIALEVDEEFTTSLPENVKIYLEKQESGTYIPVCEPVTFDKIDSKSSYGAPEGSKIVAKVSSDKSTSHNYRLRMWLAEETIVTPEVIQSFGIEINVYGEAK